jgi:hypothetical protein
MIKCTRKSIEYIAALKPIVTVSSAVIKIADSENFHLFSLINNPSNTTYGSIRDKYKLLRRITPVLLIISNAFLTQARAILLIKCSFNGCMTLISEFYILL